MTKVCLSAVLLSLLLLVSTALPSELEVSTMEKMTSIPLTFAENQGQWDEEVMFRANAGGAAMWFTAGGACYQFTRRHDGGVAAHEKMEKMMIRASFVGANPNPRMVGKGVLEYKCNYFFGDDPTQSRTDVPNYGAIFYEDVYPGIDLKYYGNGKEMEYDFIVSPGVDPSQIKIKYDGVESVSVNGDGELVVETRWGEVIERRPFVYQIQDNTRVPIESRYEITADNSFSFSVEGSYNPALTLVIDPILSYSTYLGGSNDDYGRAIAVDASGAAYVTGYTNSDDFPTVSGYQATLQGSRDVFVTKLSADGGSLIYSTYLGGEKDDLGFGIAVDDAGSAYVTGETDSEDFPTAGAYQGIRQGAVDAFVAKLSPAGNSLVYSTYLGGEREDYGRAIALDAEGAAYVTGITESEDFPTVNPYQGTFGGRNDVFATKLGVDGTSLDYSTYLGGEGEDFGYGIAVDVVGSAYVTGETRSDDFPTESGYQETYQGDEDAFVTKLSAAGNSLVYSTYLGGDRKETGRGIALDAAGSAYVTGETESEDFPTVSAYQATSQGGIDGFVTKLSADGTGLVFSTYLGGNRADNGRGIAVDAVGFAHVTGYTDSEDFPTKRGYQVTNQGGDDVFAVKFGADGDSLVYSTYLGGDEVDWGMGIAVDIAGSACVTGETRSDNFPIENGYQATFQGSRDAFVTKLTEGPCCQLRGDLNDNGQVDILDVDYFINWLHRGGEAPECIEEADVDDNSQEDILDINYLISYLFRGGTDPVPCP